jgi:hypothetical protein
VTQDCTRKQPQRETCAETGNTQYPSGLAVIDSDGRKPARIREITEAGSLMDEKPALLSEKREKQNIK